jgi:hypothetical protein
MKATTTFRVVGLAMFAYGVLTLVLLQTDHRQWALDHSLAEVVSWSDRRAGNEIEGSVDEPMVIAGSAVLVFAGAWFGLLVPHLFRKNDRRIAAMYDDVDGASGDDRSGGPAAG